MSQDLELAAPMEVARTENLGITIESAFHAAATKALDKESLQVMKELLAMDAQRKFNAAFIELKPRLPTIQGYRGIPDRQGNIKFKYANFEDIDEIVSPICLAFGFTYLFRETAYGEGRTTTTMTLMHAAGHSIEIPCTVRVGGGPPGTSDAQNDGGAHTYGKRNALEMGLGLRIVGAREDARNEGDTNAKVTPEQADELERRVKLMNVDVKMFLRLGGSATFAGIPAKNYDVLDAMLKEKEQKGK